MERRSLRKAYARQAAKQCRCALRQVLWHSHMCAGRKESSYNPVTRQHLIMPDGGKLAYQKQTYTLEM